MNNNSVDQELQECERELLQVEALINGLGPTSNICPYLTKYAIIRACGTIERAYKAVIADYCCYRSKPQVKCFIDRRVRQNSANPSYERILNILKDFDAQWKSQFQVLINGDPNKTALMTSLQSLVDARNDFAHGGDPGATIADTIQYFKDARSVIVHLDSIIS